MWSGEGPQHGTSPRRGGLRSGCSAATQALGNADPWGNNVLPCAGRLQPQLSSSVRASNTLFISCTPLGTSFSSAHVDDEGPVLPVNTPAEQGAANQDIRSGNPSHRGFEEENGTIPELEEALAIPAGNPFSVLTKLGSDILMN